MKISDPILMFPLIVILFFHCRPATVVWRIRPPWINTIQALFRWCRPHICDEILKRVTPTIANGYSTTSIIFVRSSCWAMTTLFHRNPNTIFSSCVSHCRNAFFSFRSFCMSVFSFCFSQPFTVKTAARFGLFIQWCFLPLAKILNAHPLYRSTIAETFPICPVRSFFPWANNGQTSVFMTC